MTSHLRVLLLLTCAFVGWGGSARADVGTLRFDTGVATRPATTGSPAVPDLAFGNRFDAGIGLNSILETVLATGTVTRVSFYLAGYEPPFLFLTVFGPVNGSTAPPLTTVNLTGATLGWNTHTFATPVTYTGGSFLVGIWTRNQATTGATDDAVALDTGTRLGQGHHGFSIVDQVGTGFAPLAANALVRATGDFLPPELILDAQVTALLDDTLQVDSDLSGTISAGDTVRYTVTIDNAGSEAAPIARFEIDPDPATTLVPGSVTTSQGTVERGNAAGDPRVEIDLGALGASSVATASFDVALADPLPGGITPLQVQGAVSGLGFSTLPSDDPATPAPDDPTLTAIDDPTAPFGPAAVLKPKLKLRFDAVGKDTLKLKVKRWEIPGGLVVDGNLIRIDVGGVVLDATLDAKGRYKAVNDKVKVKQRKKDGTWKLSVKRRSGDWAALLLDEGLDALDNVKKPVPVRVRAAADGVVYQAPVALEYTSTAGKKGKAKLP